MSSNAENWFYIRIRTQKGWNDELSSRLTQSCMKYGALGSCVEGTSLLIYFKSKLDPLTIERFNKLLHTLLTPEIDGYTEWETGLEPNQEWTTRCMEYFRRVSIGSQISIRPDWDMLSQESVPGGNNHVIWIRPGAGFGTGHHETTHLALELLEKQIRPGIGVLDFGSGSGILAIAAVRLGAKRVIAVEIDAHAIDNAKDNIHINKCQDKILLTHSGLPPSNSNQFDLVLCNMLPVNALPHIKNLANLCRSNKSTLIYSGFLTDQKIGISRALMESGLEILEFCRKGEWGAMVLAPGERHGTDESHEPHN